MFSPDASVVNALSASQRNPRRRRRNETDTGTQRQPRKRSRIAQDQFEPVANGKSSQNGHATNGVAPALNHIPVREKRLASSGYRPSKSDASTVLTKNSNYTVKLLPAVPERLRSNTRAPFRPSFRSTISSHYAVATTQEAVIIWDYTFSGASPTARVLNLPYPVKSSESLPIASLITNASSSDVGLVLVYPNTGKITFWENVDSAESLKLFEQRRQGIEGSIKLLGGETIEEVVDAEHAGFVLLTGAGRLAQLTVRDAQGRPHVNVTFLTNGSKGSFLGDLVHMFHTSWRNRPTAVKARPSIKGRMEVITLTNEGVFKFWDATWAGQNSFTGEIDASMEVRMELVKAGVLDPEQKGAAKFVDFALLNDTSNELAIGGSASLRALILISTEGTSKTQFSLVQVILAAGLVTAESVIPLTVYEPSTAADVRPRLIISALDLTAFVVHEEAVVVVSLSSISAESKLHFQDVLHFQSKRGGKITATTVEVTSSMRDSSILLFTKSAGIVRLSLNNHRPEGKKHHLPGAKSKIEQWVYYGDLADNILDLADLTGLPYSTEDIESAALRISQEVLRTATEYLPSTTPSMDQHLAQRVKALEQLARFLKEYCPPLSRNTKWILLLDYEKMTAAQAIWRQHEVRLQEKSMDEMTLLEDLVDRALERSRDNGNSEVDHIDDTRLWFTKEVHRIEKIFNLACAVIMDISKTGQSDTVTLCRHIKEAIDILSSGLTSPFDKREERLEKYGLSGEDIENGVLLSGYEGLPELWTSTTNTVHALSKIVALAEKVSSTLIKKSSDNPTTFGWARKIASDTGTVVRLSCKSHVERYRWLQAQEDVVAQGQGLDLQHEFETKIRREQITALFDMGEVYRGLILAEEVDDLSALVELSLKELDDKKAKQLGEGATAGRQRIGSSTDELEYIENQIARYFRKFGQDFATEFHKGQLASHRLADLIDKDLGPKGERTKFLRSHSAYAKLSWINEALNEDDMVETGKNLMIAACNQEPNIWCKKLELSLAKLALQSAGGPDLRSDTPNEVLQVASPEEMNMLLEKNSRELSVLRIQQQLYQHIRPTILEALDQDVAPQEVMRIFGAGVLASRHSLAELLKNGFYDIISHRSLSPETLIDVLTLMDQDPGASSPLSMTLSNSKEARKDGVFGKEFYLALKVLESTDLKDDDIDMYRRLIWKRCLLRDSNNWGTLGDTNEKSDLDVAEGLMHTVAFETVKQGFREGMFAPPLNISIPLPSQVVGAGSAPEDFKNRFPADLCGPIAADNAAEDGILKGLVDHDSLDELFKLLQGYAQDAAEEEGNEVLDKSRRYAAFVEHAALSAVVDDEVENDESDVFIKEEEGELDAGCRVDDGAMEVDD